MNSSLKKIPVPGSDPKEITLGTKKKHHVQLLRVKISQKRKEGLRKQWWTYWTEYYMATKADVSKSIKTPGKCILVCCCCSVTKLCLTLCDPTVRSTPSLPVPQLSCPSQSSPKFISIELVISSNHLILCHPLCLLSSIFPSIRVFSKELALPI